ncbi:hypothetical protein F4777DRAFT_529023 [Nemania sp. FL0916]|nr:hypothetical protein F4777DRAFT_529023 [Nemania sp. FL0916]
MASTGDVVRPVGTHAKYNTARNSLGILHAVVVTCRYKISAAHLRQQSLSLHDMIENALGTVVLEQAMLRVGIVGEDTKEPAFVHLETVNLKHMVEWVELKSPSVKLSPESESEARSRHRAPDDIDDGLLRSLEKYHQSPWEDLTNKPGWKLVVHHDPAQLQSKENGALASLDIAFCYHHAYADGRGGYIFHSALQRALNNLVQAPELRDPILHIPAQTLLPPPMGELIPFRLSWPFILRTAWAELLYPALVPVFLRRVLCLEPSAADIPWTGNSATESDSDVEKKMHIRTLVAVDDEAQLRNILAQCRSHKTSLTGLLHALIARSLAGSVRDRAFCSITPISLAGYVDRKVASTAFTPGETIHCLVTGLTSAHDRDAIQALRRDGPQDGRNDDGDAAMWAFASNMTSRLRAKAASLPRDDIQALAGLVGDWHAFFRGKLAQPREATWELSNLGSLDNGEGQGPWLIDRAMFTQGANPVGPALCVNVAGVAGHGIHVNATWQDGALDSDIVEKLADDMRASIAELGDA